jgi:LacI family transcriptional regulator
MPRRRSTGPTIADVARESGVGTMTVSRVVNGGQLVSAATANKVRAAIEKLGYQPNEAARILKGQVPRTIGLIVPNLADPFFSICAHAAQQMAAKFGYTTLLLAAERDPESGTSELAMMKFRNIAGILIAPTDPDCLGQLQEMRKQGIPVVMLDRTFPGLDAGEVMVENDEGAQKAVNHLIEHGHESILCIGYDSQFNSIGLRISGYEKAMQRAGLKPRLAVVNGSEAVAPKMLQRLHSAKPPTALFTLNNVTTMKVLEALQRENIAVPQDLAIVGFDDFELAPLLAVPLTTVRQPAAELGRSATRLLLDWIRGSSGSGARTLHARVVLPTELVIRRSCGCEPIRKIGAEFNGNHARKLL